MRRCQCLLWVLLSPVVSAGELVSLQFAPSEPLPGQAVEVIVGVPFCTMLPEQGTVIRNGADVVLALEVPDYCVQPEFVPERRYSIGAFAQGEHVFTLQYCGNAPPPLPRCNAVAARAFSVGLLRVAVPATAPWALLVLAALVMTSGWSAALLVQPGRLIGGKSWAGRGWAKRKPWP